MSFGSRSLPPPTAAQLRRWARIQLKGCVCCQLGYGIRNPAELHHLKSGNLRMGHDYTVGLCVWHHRGQPNAGETAAYMAMHRGPSLASGSVRFYAAFGGSQDGLLVLQNRMIDWAAPPVRERNRKSRCTASGKTVPRPAGGFA